LIAMLALTLGVALPAQATHLGPVLLGHGNDGQSDETSIRAVNATSVFAVHQIGGGTGLSASA
jgi:hypothetical protein